MESDTNALAGAIGGRVRAERQSLGWTLDRLAETAGVSRRMVVNVEQGLANPSVGTLLKIADALGVGLPALVEPPTRSTVRVTRAREGAELWTSDAGGRGILVASVEHPHIVELWDWRLAANDRHASEAHTAGTRELVHVREGVVEIESDGESVTLRAGDAIAFPGDRPHAYTNPSDAPARFSLAVFEPRPGSGPPREAENA